MLGGRLFGLFDDGGLEHLPYYKKEKTKWKEVGVS